MGFRRYLSALLVMMGMQIVYSQQGDPEAAVKLHTVMERYAPEYVLPPEERRRLKSERNETIASRLAVIDTLDISRRKKRRLLRELYNTPFTEEYREVLGSMQPEEEEEVTGRVPD